MKPSVAVAAEAAVCSSASFSGLYLRVHVCFPLTLSEPRAPHLTHARHSPSGAAELERLFWAVSTPGNPEYLQHRSISQLKAIIGASEDTLSKAKAFLRAAGASNIIVSPLADHVVGKFSIAEAAALGATWGPEDRKDPSFEFVLRRDLNKPQHFSFPQKQSSLRAPGGQYAVNPVKRSFGMPTDLKASNDSTLQMVWGA